MDANCHNNPKKRKRKKNNQEPSTSQAIGRGTKRKASPEKTTKNKKIRGALGVAGPSEEGIRGEERTVLEELDVQLPLARRTRRRLCLNQNNKPTPPFLKRNRNTDLGTTGPSTSTANDRVSQKEASPEQRTKGNNENLLEVAETSEKNIKGRRRKGKETQLPRAKRTRRGLCLNQNKNESSSSADRDRDRGRNRNQKPNDYDSSSSNNTDSDTGKNIREDNASSRWKNRTRRGDRSNQHANESSSSSEDSDVDSAAFKAKYKQLSKLGIGGCGSVFAGYRREDRLPVAIKHVPQDNVFCKPLGRAGKKLPAEVAIMHRLAAGADGSEGMSAAVALLDWYNMGNELILILERPDPAVDLLKYIQGEGDMITEREIKSIMNQLVDAAIGLEDRSIFHRDIKMENILIERSSGVPRIRLIDFGLSCIVKRGSFYSRFYGTCSHIPPEWYRCSTYSAGPTTVWQLGIVLYEMVHASRFDTKKMLKKGLKVGADLSQGCKHFLHACLKMFPKQRPTLRELRLHPWLAETSPNQSSSSSSS